MFEWASDLKNEHATGTYLQQLHKWKTWAQEMSAQTTVAIQKKMGFSV